MRWFSRLRGLAVFGFRASHLHPHRRGDVPWAASGNAAIDEGYLLQTFLANTPDHVYFKDAESRFTQISSSLGRWIGVEVETNALGLTDFDFFADEHACAAREDELRVMRTGEAIVDLEEREVFPDGRITWVSTTKVPLYSRDGRMIGIFGLSRDITARKLAEERAREQAQELERLTRELEELAIHDALTGLYNRRGVELMGRRAVTRASHDGNDACALFIDVDGLKSLNDGLGHTAGDRVLIHVANVLRDAVRATDIVGRIGGDEFTVVLAGQSAHDAEELRERIELAMQRLPSAENPVSVSIGIATRHRDAAETLDDLIDAADRSMYAVKRQRAITRASTERRVSDLRVRPADGAYGAGQDKPNSGSSSAGGAPSSIPVG
jgi:diguanylate cyclase (GGDEF)-like protein/PAS domain S-box-containing protein